MLDNSITLPVDETNAGGATANHVFSRHEEYQNRSLYIGEGHLPGEARNQLAFYRTAPKPSGNFKGTRKTSIKLTRDCTVAGVDGSTLTSPRIIEVSFSFPVGAAAADIVLDRQTVIALLDVDTIMDSLNVQQSV